MFEDIETIHDLIMGISVTFISILFHPHPLTRPSHHAPLTLPEYWDSVEYFCVLCQEHLSEEFVSFIVVGSLSVGDIVPGWSDVDGYLVVESVTDEVRNKVTAISNAIAEKYPFYKTDRGSRFCALVVSKDEVLKGGGQVSFLSHWDLKRYGVVACGENFIRQLPEPNIEMDWLDNHTEWMLDFLKKDKDASTFWKGRNAIGFIITGARNAILKKRKYAKKKDEIVEVFSRLFPEKADLLIRAMDYRLNWLGIQKDKEAIDIIYDEAVEFLQWVRSLS